MVYIRISVAENLSDIICFIFQTQKLYSAEVYNFDMKL
jgi:hypothetical protein